MPRYPLFDAAQKARTIGKLELRITTLNKAVADLPSLCDCEARYSLTEELALAEKLAGLLTREFKQELNTGIRASVDHMAPSKAEGNTPKRREHRPSCDPT